MSKIFVGLAAIAALLPAGIAPLRRDSDGPDGAFWALLAVAVAGPTVYVATQLSGPWQGGLSATLWISVSASTVLFAALCVATREAWRLTPLLFAYLVLLSVIAMVWGQAPPQARPVPTDAGPWLMVHIVLSVLAYALATIAAVAGAAVLIQERALKKKRPNTWTAVLPSVADAERMQVRLLGAAGAVLGVDLMSGMAVQYVVSGVLMRFEHKPLLSLLAFVVILGLLAVHQRSGVRGRFAARLILVAYLLLTLGYPGVKFVTDVLIA